MAGGAVMAKLGDSVVFLELSGTDDVLAGIVAFMIGDSVVDVPLPMVTNCVLFSVIICVVLSGGKVVEISGTALVVLLMGTNVTFSVVCVVV